MAFLTEKDVEHRVKSILERATKSQFTSPNNTDGVLEFADVRLLLEAKLDALTSADNRAKTIAQTLHYVHNMDVAPNVILIADATHYALIHPGMYTDVRDMDVDWTRAPSTPCPNLVNAVRERASATLIEHLAGLGEPPFIAQCKRIASSGITVRAPITVTNVKQLFERFSNTVLARVKYSAPVNVDIFLSCITRDDEEVYVHPRKPNTLVVNGGDYTVDIQAFKAFFNTYQRGYSPSQIDMFHATRDRLLEDEVRRRQGAFYTPLIWADEAHKEIENTLGHNWREECVVWDCCAGTANLTREYDFDNLIISTVEASDVQTIKREAYNEGAHIFQYDFLNPDAESPYVEGENVIPRAVQRLLKQGARQGKRLVFFINPPYAEDGVMGAKGTTRKGVATSTYVGRTMPKLGRANRQLYTQFLYQCETLASEYGFRHTSIGVFSGRTFMSSKSFSKFREFWYSRYEYMSGFIFRASHFADVKDSWGIAFSLWSSGSTDIADTLCMTPKDIREGRVVDGQRKLIYNADVYRSGSDWVSYFAPKATDQDTPKFSSGLRIREVAGNVKGTLPTSLGVMCNSGNNLMESASGVILLSGKPTHKGRCNFDILEGESWRRAIALYSARKLVSGNWLTNKDEYLAPEADKAGYDQWVDDCHVYTLLQTSNNITSMRDIEYRNFEWDIHNHFFWHTRESALRIYDHADALPMYRDAKRSKHEPYFAQILPDLDLSPLAQEILADLDAILRDPATHRARTSADPSEHARSWDIGAYQLNRLLKTTPSWIALKAKHLKLRDQLAHGVYTFGFLKR
jgi:hypothetical protein